ncbi:hypothetical protein [Acidovorax sp. SUPP2825]|uniref:hypothetical protein n=1 Tax=Acidovorax sp. SUPP2825 TaxID=2920879 RepID=UPI0023DE27B4|nr:hypothetical protein [Acidovorax sp. SUPP2825]GKS97590.1 hypothetical protein AVAK2825_23665 [Acidovorax sp. SUPP2825]
MSKIIHRRALSLVLAAMAAPTVQAQITVQGWTVGSWGSDGRSCYPSIQEACTIGGNGQLSPSPTAGTGYTCREMGTEGPYWAAINKCYYQQFPTLVALSGASETRPAAKGGSSEITLIAKVTNSTAAKSGVALGFSVDVTPNSGGHEHHDVARPKGLLSATQGVTDANGEVKIVFKAPEVAGIHTIQVACAVCSNSPVSKEIQVRVPDLLPISPNPPQNADGTFVYALTSVDKTHQGNGRYHHNQYYLTQQSLQNLLGLIGSFAAEGWGTVALNDASLFWGGRYDITSNWRGPHAGHREGREIDISFTRARNPVSIDKQNNLYKKFCEANAAEVPFSILHHYASAPHFHIFLEKQKACFKSEH